MRNFISISFFHLFLFFSIFSAVLSHSAKAIPLSFKAVPNEYVVQFAMNDRFQIKSVPKNSSNRLMPIDIDRGIYKIRLKTGQSEFDLKKELRNFPIKNIEPNYIYQLFSPPQDPLFLNQWGLSNRTQNSAVPIDIDAEKAWTLTSGKSDVVVAVVDTGVDYNHPDLSANIWINQAEAQGRNEVDDDGNGYVDDMRGYDFANSDNDPFDDMYHGTHCAGIIGAQGNNQLGITGVNWNVKLMPLKIFKPNEGGNLANIIKALDYAQKNGARVVNASWGGGAPSKILSDSIESLGQSGILFVAAAGNSGVNSDINPQFPASYPLSNVISVGALEKSGKLADFSNYGSRNVHVAAPGVDVLSTLPDAKYGLLSGTSMAAPFVSGVAALVLSLDPNISLSDLRSRLIKRGNRLGELKNKVSSRTMLNAFAALTNQTQYSEFDPNDPEQWQQKDYSLKTSSPYQSKSRVTYQIKIEGARRIALHFSKFSTEEGFDILRIYDNQNKLISLMSGYNEDSYSEIIVGDSARLEWETDEENVDLGFEIDKVGFQ